MCFCLDVCFVNADTDESIPAGGDEPTSEEESEPSEPPMAEGERGSTPTSDLDQEGSKTKKTTKCSLNFIPDISQVL